MAKSISDDEIIPLSKFQNPTSPSEAHVEATQLAHDFVAKQMKGETIKFPKDEPVTTIGLDHSSTPPDPKLVEAFLNQNPTIKLPPSEQPNPSVSRVNETEISGQGKAPSGKAK